jgi:hypothetical protein
MERMSNFKMDKDHKKVASSDSTNFVALASKASSQVRSRQQNGSRAQSGPGIELSFYTRSFAIPLEGNAALLIKPVGQKLRGHDLSTHYRQSITGLKGFGIRVRRKLLSPVSHQVNR